MQQLLSFWYGQSPSWVWHHFITAIHGLDGRFAVGDTLRNLNKPLFQDYTFQGRVVGVLLRLIRVFTGVFVYGFTFLGFLLFYLLWLAFPIICLVSLISSFIASPPLPLS